METRLMIALAIVVFSIVALGAVDIASSQETPASSACDQHVEHRALMSSSAIQSVNETGSATSRLRNTVVVVEEATGFVRLRADNPNGYCVAYTVEIAPEIVPPADLGKIDSNAGELEAEWRAIQNLSAGSVRTRVTFTLPPGANATFAPSTVRVKSLSWTGEAKKASGSILDSISDLWSSSVLDKRKYAIEPTESSDAITVPIERGDKRIEDWIASYQLDGQRRTVTQDASAPVYYTESSSSVTFHFNDKRADVTFVADPTAIDKLDQSMSSYVSGLTNPPDWIPLTTGVTA